MNFDEIVAPLGAEAFTRDYLGRQPLHLQGPTDKFHGLMNWDVLNSLLGMTTIWSTVSLILVLDKESLPKESYAVHFWNEMWRFADQDRDAEYPEGSVYESLKRRHHRTERDSGAAYVVGGGLPGETAG